MATTLLRMNCAHMREGWQTPSCPAVTQAAPGCAVEASRTTFPVVPSTPALRKCLGSEGSGPVTPGKLVSVQESQCGLLEYELVASQDSS